jgi:hypothetical protein
MFSQKQRETLLLIHKRLRKENFYWRVGYYALVIAGVVHFGFLLLFLFLELYLLACVNVLSVLVYWYSVFGLGLKTLENKGEERLIGWLVFAELIGHNVIATYYLGAGAGFQYYIYILAALPFFISTYSMPVYLFRVGSALVIALFLDLHGFFEAPKVQVDAAVLLWFSRMNTVIALGALIILFYLYLSKERKYHDDLIRQDHSDSSDMDHESHTSQKREKELSKSKSRNRNI